MRQIKIFTEKYQRLFKAGPNCSNDTTKTEAWLWNFVLGNGQVKGYYFKRKCPVLNYTTQFLCIQLRLMVDIVQEETAEKKNSECRSMRKTVLESAGFTLLNFTSHEVKMKTREVRQKVEQTIEEMEKRAQPEVLFPPEGSGKDYPVKLLPVFRRKRTLSEPAAWRAEISNSSLLYRPHDGRIQTGSLGTQSRFSEGNPLEAGG